MLIGEKPVKKIVSIISLVVVLAFAPLCGTETANAETSTPKTMAAFVDIVDQRVREALLTSEEEYIRVDLSDLNFNYKKSHSQSYQLYYMLPYFCDEIQLHGPCIVNGIYDHLDIGRTISKAKVEAHINKVDAELATIMDAAEKATTKERKLLVFHDYIVQNTSYDMGYYTDSIASESYYAYGALMNNKAVCNGYASLFQYLCLKSGIDCRFVVSDADNHSWNMVKINKSYYHIDVTWDDPVPDILGRVSHEYFLLTDKQIRGSGHNGWTSAGLKCTSTKYTTRYWRHITSPVIFTSKYAYFVEDDDIIRRNLENGKEKSVIRGLGEWYIYGSNACYSDSYSGLFLHNNNLYFNTAEKIKKYSLRTGRVTTVVKQNYAGSIYGIRKDGNKLKYIIKKDFNDKGSVKTSKKQLL